MSYIKNKHLFCFVLLLIFSIDGCSIRSTSIEPWSTPSVTHLVDENSIENVYWTKTGVYTEQDAFTPKMIADVGKIVFIGSMETNTFRNLICLDSSNGNVIWEIRDVQIKKPEYLSSLTSNSGELFVGYGGVPSVKKYEFSSGEQLWSQSLEGRGQPYIYVLDKEVQLPTGPSWFTILDSENGDVLKTMEEDNIIISTAADTFFRWGKGIRAVETNTGKLLWEVKLDRELTLAPIFTNDIIYLRTGRVIGSLYAIERSTGKILWNTDDTFISNIAFSDKEDKVYVINLNGEVWEINGHSGERIPIIEFTNSPFQINGPVTTVGGYEIAYDYTEDILYVLLGDSRQLFAFKVE